MKPAPFKYTAAASLDEALHHLARYGDDAKVIAGGQSLMPLLALRMVRPEVLVDINKIDEMAHARAENGANDDAGGTGGGAIHIGAMVRQERIDTGDAALDRLPLLRQAVGHLGHAATRSRGTIGGSLAHADPAAELPVCMLALDAGFTVRHQSGERTIAAADFIDGPLTTVLEPGELLVTIRVPEPPSAGAGANSDIGTSFLEVARRHGDFALVALACVMTLNDGKISRLRLAAGGASDRPVRLAGVEAALLGQAPTPEAFADAAQKAAGDIDPMNDLHATADYRRKVAVTLTRRALQAAHDAAAPGAHR